MLGEYTVYLELLGGRQRQWNTEGSEFGQVEELPLLRAAESHFWKDDVNLMLSEKRMTC